jgi:hypothetical protein
MVMEAQAWRECRMAGGCRTRFGVGGVLKIVGVVVGWVLGTGSVLAHVL